MPELHVTSLSVLVLSSHQTSKGVMTRKHAESRDQVAPRSTVTDHYNRVNLSFGHTDPIFLAYLLAIPIALPLEFLYSEKRGPGGKSEVVI
jgi:hypothetical protein